MKREYFSTNAPMIIGKQVIIGVGGDALDIPGYLESRDPETGNLVWRWNTAPRAGEAGANTWPDEDSMSHGGGMPWLPGTYDPELNLYYFGTGNPQPVLAGQSRKKSIDILLHKALSYPFAQFVLTYSDDTSALPVARSSRK